MPSHTTADWVSLEVQYFLPASGGRDALRREDLIKSHILDLQGIVGNGKDGQDAV
jgi:hypothetical protein